MQRVNAPHQREFVRVRGYRLVAQARAMDAQQLRLAAHRGAGRVDLDQRPTHLHRNRSIPRAKKSRSTGSALAQAAWHFANASLQPKTQAWPLRPGGHAPRHIVLVSKQPREHSCRDAVRVGGTALVGARTAGSVRTEASDGTSAGRVAIAQGGARSDLVAGHGGQPAGWVEAEAGQECGGSTADRAAAAVLDGAAGPLEQRNVGDEVDRQAVGRAREASKSTKMGVLNIFYHI
jgi:hypothetical protein